MTDSAELNHERVLQTLYEVLDSDNSLSRCRAVRALERVDGREEESRKHLIDMLMDPDPDVRTDAAVTLGRMRLSEATDPLLYSLENDPDGEVRVEAVKALAAIGSPTCVEPLIRCLEADGYPELEDEDIDDEMPYAACFEVHSRTLEALGKLGDARATEVVIALLENDEYVDLQERGFRVLSGLDDDRARTFLLGQLDSEDALARRRAACALALPGRLEADDEVLSTEIVNRLTSALMDPDPGVRIHAARALSGSSNPLVVVPLTMLLADPETEVRREVAKVLGRMQGRLIVERLHVLLADPDPTVRREVARVLGEIGDSASLANLVPLLESEDEDLRHDVIEAIGRIGEPGPEAKPAAKLAAILADEKAHFSVRVQAATALGKLLRSDSRTESEGESPPPELMTALREAVCDSRDAVCQAALVAFTEIDPDNAVTLLSELVRGRHPVAEPPAHTGVGTEIEAEDEEMSAELHRLIVERDATTSTLAAMVAPSMDEASVEAEPDESDRQPAPRDAVRALAARLLGGCSPAHGSQAAACLMEAFENGDGQLRCEIIVALGRIGDPDALPLIAQGLACADQEIRLAALDALAGFPGESAADEQLIALLDDESAGVRERAVQIIGAVRSPTALAQLPRMLGDSDQAVCRAALRALPGDMKSEELCNRIVDLMFAYSAELTVDAAAALTRMNDRESAARLVAMLEDPGQEEFHWICIDALAEMFSCEPQGRAC